MQVVAPDGAGLFAVCESRGERRRLDMMLVGEQPPGTWVLEFQGAARRVLAPAEAEQTLAALQALDCALRGETGSIDALFADLVGREPQLPEHLRER
jgi:HupF/HypC family.